MRVSSVVPVDTFLGIRCAQLSEMPSAPATYFHVSIPVADLCDGDRHILFSARDKEAGRLAQATQQLTPKTYTNAVRTPRFLEVLHRIAARDVPRGSITTVTT